MFFQGTKKQRDGLSGPCALSEAKERLRLFSSTGARAIRLDWRTPVESPRAKCHPNPTTSRRLPQLRGAAMDEPESFDQRFVTDSQLGVGQN